MVSSVYDYDAIRRVRSHDEPHEIEIEARYLGQGWNPPHLRAQAALVYQCVRQPIAWCENPIRFGWGEPGLTWWCTSILAQRKKWDFPVVDKISLGHTELPSSWCFSHRHDEHKSLKEFGSFEEALEALAKQLHEIVVSRH